MVPVDSQTDGVIGEGESGTDHGTIVGADRIVGAILQVVVAIEGVLVAENEVPGDGGKDAIAGFGGDGDRVGFVVAGIVDGLVRRDDDDILAGELVLQVGDFGGFVGVLDEGVDAGADAGEGENREDNDDREDPFALRFRGGSSGDRGFWLGDRVFWSRGRRGARGGWCGRRVRDVQGVRRARGVKRVGIVLCFRRALRGVFFGHGFLSFGVFILMLLYIITQKSWVW